MHRGNDVLSKHCTPSIFLQWGRGEFTAEMSVRGERMSLAVGLQWGRGEFTAEIGRPIQQLLQRAGRLQWGRGEFTAEMIPCRRLKTTGVGLQWGRGEFTAEIHRRWLIEFPTGEYPSMGPR